MNWVTAKNLENWANRRDCQEKLPLVVRKLIRATVTGIDAISFPAGESIVYPGWDGLLQSFEKTEYIPEGLSVWEIGTSQNVRKKIEEDYQKRKQNPLNVDPKEATFVSITPRVWTEKEKWINGKKKENFWKDVRVYNARDLEE